MDNVTAGIIDDTEFGEEATAPKTECADGVRQCEPQRDKYHPSEEVHAAEERPRHDDESDGGEDELEVYCFFLIN